MEINQLIENEMIYFDKILSQQNKITVDELEIWRSETLAERKTRLSKEIYAELDGTVVSGPFYGLELTSETWWGGKDLGSMLIGTYELELLNIFNDIQKNQFDNFIDIGAADGYYACGMLVAKKVKRSICFEISEEGRRVIKENWLLNGAPGTLEIFGEANTDNLKNLNGVDYSKTLILMDIEGEEFDLIDENFLNAVRGATLIVEIHNWDKRFCKSYESILRAINKYFRIEIIQPIDRPTNSLPFLQTYTDENRALIVSEGRPCVMRFLKLVPKK